MRRSGGSAIPPVEREVLQQDDTYDAGDPLVWPVSGVPPVVWSETWSSGGMLGEVMDLQDSKSPSSPDTLPPKLPNYVTPGIGVVDPLHHLRSMRGEGKKQKMPTERGSLLLRLQLLSRALNVVAAPSWILQTHKGNRIALIWRRKW